MKDGGAGSLIMAAENHAHESENADINAAIEETLRGDTAAFATVVNRFTPLLYSLSLRMLGNRDDAEEAVQEIFLKAFAGLRFFRREKRFLPWLYTIALNYLRSHHKKRLRRRRMEQVLPHEELLSRPDDTGGTEPARTMFLTQAEEAAGRALLGIRHDYRAVFILRAIEGLPVSEVAAIMGIPEGTVKTYYKRAREQLAKIILRATHETPSENSGIY